LCDVKALHRLIGRLSSVEELIPVIKGTEIGKVVLSHIERSNFGEISKALWSHLVSTIHYLMSRIPKKWRSRIYTYLRRYDLHNIVISLTSLVTGARIRVEDLVPLGVIESRGLLAKLCEVASVNDLVELLRECGLGRYGDLIEELAPEVKDISYILPIESRLYWQYVCDLRDCGDPVLEFLSGVEYDLKLMLNVLRCKVMGVEEHILSRAIPRSGYLLSDREVSKLISIAVSDFARVLRETVYSELSRARVREVTDFERCVEEYFLGIVEYVAKRPQFTISDVVSVMMLKEMEVKVLRTLISSLLLSPRRR